LRRITVLTIMFICMAPPPAVAIDRGDPARGWVVAQVRCQPCHFLRLKRKKLGPGLLGVYGRPPSIRGIPFPRWNAHALDIWLSGPRKVKANTTMYMPPLSPRDRADVIAWLRQVGKR